MATNVVAVRAIYQVLGCRLDVANCLLGKEGLVDCEDLAELDPLDVH